MEPSPEHVQLLRIIHLCPGLNYRAYAQSRELTSPLIRAGLVINIPGGYADPVYRGRLYLSPSGMAFLSARGLNRFGYEPDEEFAQALRRFEAARKAYNFQQLPTHEDASD